MSINELRAPDELVTGSVKAGENGGAVMETRSDTQLEAELTLLDTELEKHGFIAAENAPFGGEALPGERLLRRYSNGEHELTVTRRVNGTIIIFDLVFTNGGKSLQLLHAIDLASIESWVRRSLVSLPPVPVRQNS